MKGGHDEKNVFPTGEKVAIVRSDIFTKVIYAEYSN